MRRLRLAPAAALCCLVLAARCAAAEEMPTSAAEAAASAPATDPTPGGNKTVTGAGGSGVAAGSVCNPASLNAAKPVPCTEEQEADALADLMVDTPSSSDPQTAVFDTSICDPADPEGYTEPVDLADSSLMEVRGQSWCVLKGSASCMGWPLLSQNLASRRAVPQAGPASAAPLPHTGRGLASIHSSRW